MKPFWKVPIGSGHSHGSHPLAFILLELLILLPAARAAPRSTAPTLIEHLSPPLFVAAPLRKVVSKPLHDRFCRSRKVILDTRWLTRPTASVTLNLFTNAVVPGVLDSYALRGGTEVFWLHAANDPATRGILAYNHGCLAGVVFFSDGRLYEILPRSGGIHRIGQLDPGVPFCGVGATASSLGRLRKPSLPGNGYSTRQMVKARPRFVWIPTRHPPCVLSLLVGYTTDAKNYFGGVNGVEAVVAVAAAYMNDALERSHIAARLRIAAEVEITWRRDSNDGYQELYQVSQDANLRRRSQNLGAPLISELFHATCWPAGVAYISSAYSVFSSAGPTLAHEVGHCLGCNHDRANASAGSTRYPCSYGYSFKANGCFWGTIMSYVGSTIPYYSNPLIDFMGIPTGVPAGHVDFHGQPDSADNAFTIAESAPIWAESLTSQDYRLEQARLNPGGTFSFSIEGPSASQVTIESTTDYSSWEPLGLYEFPGGTLTLTDPMSSDVTARFYRCEVAGSPLRTEVGFMRVSVPPGYSMVGCQLDAGDNSVGSLFPAPADGTVLFKWDVSTQSFTANSFAAGQWESPAMTLNPGEGVVVWSPQAQVFPFAGEVLNAFDEMVYPGWSIRCSPVPQSGLISSTLAYPIWPIHSGDELLFMNGTQGHYDAFRNDAGNWEPTEPRASLGEAFWCWVKKNNEEWQRVFWTCP